MGENDILQLILNKVTGLESRFDGLESRFDGLESRFDGLECRFDNLESRFDGLEGRFDGLEGRFDGLECRFDGLECKVDGIAVDVSDLKERVTVVEQRTQEMKLILENETSTNIRIIAEGHLDLIHKLNDAIRADQTREMYFIKTNILESDVRALKDDMVLLKQKSAHTA